MPSVLPELSDHQITQAMKDCGGGFVKQLGHLYRLADETNQARIKAAWPELWQNYTEMAERLRCPECGQSNILNRHHDGNIVTPECDFKECEDCGHQFGHN